MTYITYCPNMCDVISYPFSVTSIDYPNEGNVSAKESIEFLLLDYNSFFFN